MSLHAWDWDDDKESMGALSSMISFYPSEYEMDEYVKVKTFSQDSDSDRACSSEGSTHATGSTYGSDVPHVVPCRFIISLAFPVGHGYKGKYTNLIERNRRHLKMDKPMLKNRRFFHLEYFLLPDDIEPKKVDILLFPLVAKVFLDSGLKTVKLWNEGDKVWVSWAQTFNINMTKELLKKINFHSITLRLWDTKDKVAKKVRYYRLKTSGYLEDVGSFEEVRHLVLNQRKLSEHSNHIKEEPILEVPPGKSEKFKKQLKSGNEPESLPKSMDEYEKLLKMEDFSALQWSVSGKPSAMGGIAGLAMKEIIQRTSFGSITNLSDKQKFPMRLRDANGKKKSSKKKKKSPTEEDMESKHGGHWKPETFSVQLPVTPLLAGGQSIVGHASWKSATVLGCYLTLSTKVPIMTEEQRQDLNPLTIRIKCASCLPSQPVSIQELEKLCMPVYCKYQFHKAPVHRTQGQPHGTHVCFQDTNVIFLGVMHPSDLKEYLEGPPMLVEVHDRDRKMEEASQKPTLFGEDPLDTYLNSHALISSKETESNPFEFQKKVWDPYGVARVSFADLLLGRKYLNLDVPILSCDPRPINLSLDCRDRKAVGILLPKDSVQPVPMGNYLEASSLLKLRVDVAVPLQLGREPLEVDQEGATTFGRVVFVFEASRRLALLFRLLQDVTTINAEALELDSYPLENIQQILSAFKMRVKIQDQPDLDVLTGFHLVDGRLHVLILEGLAERGLRRLWESHQSRISNWEPGQVGRHKALYDSQLLFRSRLYADLETILYHVHLFQPMALLLKRPEIYIRNAVPKEALQALTRIYCICHHGNRLREVISRDLLPTSSMVKVLSQEFGLPISQEDLMEGKMLTEPRPPTSHLQRPCGRTSTLTQDILAHQKRYLQWRSSMFKSQGCKLSLVQKNIKDAYQTSRKSMEATVQMMRVSVPGQVHNYSIQTLNSTQLAKKLLYQQMAKEPGRRFTYSQKYLSATVEPRDTEEEEEAARMRSRQAWRTPSGFQVMGLQKSTECYCPIHLLSLGPRKEHEEWREAALFANILRPVLDRDRWGWEHRHRDFELYKKPPPFLPLPPARKPLPGELSLLSASPARDKLPGWGRARRRHL